VRIHLGRGTRDRARDRLGNRLDGLPRPLARVTWTPVSCDITSKNSVSVDTGYTTLT